MPLREFRCGRCKTRFEELVRSGADNNVACPRCGSKRLRRLMSGFVARRGGSSPAAVSAGSSCSGCSGGDCSTCN